MPVRYGGCNPLMLARVWVAITDWDLIEVVHLTQTEVGCFPMPGSNRVDKQDIGQKYRRFDYKAARA